jgi:hypothetical protein
VSKVDLLLEAERRGILPADKKPLLDEARKRGLIPSEDGGEDTSGKNRSDWSPEMRAEYRDRKKFLDDNPAFQGGYADRATQSGLLEGGDELSAGLETAVDVPFAVLRGESPDIVGRFNKNWAGAQAYRDTTMENTGGEGFSFADLIGGLATGAPRAIASGVAAAVPTMWEAAKTGAVVAPAFGGATRFLADEGSVTDRAAEALDPRALAFDVAIGGGLGAALHGAGTALERRAARKQEAQATRAETARVASLDAQAEGIELPAVALTENPAIQGVASGLSNTIFGGPLRRQIDPAIDALEGRVRDTIAVNAGGAVPTPQNAGEAIQGNLRNLLTERSTPSGNIRGMPDDELSRITGPIADAGFLPNRPVVPQVPPRTVAEQSPDPYYTPPSASSPNQTPPYDPVQPQYREPDPAMFNPSAEELARVSRAQTTLLELEQALPNAIAARDQSFEQLAGFAQQYPKVFKVTTGEGGARSISVNKRVQDAIDRYRNYDEYANTWEGTLGGVTANEFKAAQLMHNTKRYVVDVNASKVDETTSNIERWRKESEKLTADMENRRIKGLEQERVRLRKDEDQRVSKINAEREAEAKRLAEVNAEGTARTVAETRARMETDRLRQIAEQDAQTQTRAAQAAADDQYQTDLAAAKRDGVGEFRPGRTGETYPTDFDAAYELADRAAPSGNLGNVLGSRSDPPLSTNMARLLDDIASERRGSDPNFSGYKSGQVFGADGTGPLDDRIVRHLRQTVGDDVAERIVMLAERRRLNQATTGNQGLRDIRTEIGRALGEARRAGRTPGETRALDEATLSRLYDAFSTDRNALLTARGGERAVQMYGQVDPAYRSYINDLRKPLSKVFGDKVNSVDALNKLVEATRPGGNADLLRSYYRVMQEKGNPAQATSLLLRHMTEGGMEGFLKSYRNLSPDARRIMSEGSSSEIMQSLDRLSRIGGQLERFGRGNNANEWERFTQRATNPGHVMAGIMMFINVPMAIGGALGANAASRVLSSRWFANWLRTAPEHLPVGARREAWDRHASRLAAQIQANLGVSDKDAEAVADAVGEQRTEGN